MAISPPTDIVLDVLNNADPAVLEVAQAKLKAGQATAEAQRLASTDESFAAIMRSDPVADAHKLKHRLDGADKKQVPETYRKFEAMVLQNFVKSMLPTDSDNVFGKGNAGDIWKSMMAEQIGDVISKSGGIGIAEQLAGAEGTDRVQASLDGNSRNLAASLVQEYERKTLTGFTTDNDKNKQA
jgi:flagellar protein FlgJ